MDKQPIIVVFGSLNYDYVMWADKLPRLGETVVGKRFGTFIGGKGANQAVQAARLGARTYMIGRIGNDAMGDAVLKSLKDSGVITDFVKRDPVKGTGTASVMVDNEGNNYLMISPEANGACEKSDIDDAVEVIKSADILITQLETTVPLAEYALKVAKENKVTTILNPAPAIKVPESIFKLADIVTPNETEAEAHTGLVQMENIEEWCSKVNHKFNAMGAGTVIITLGKNGAFIGRENEERIIPAYAGINAVDATAAGDSFNAALAVALAEGKNIVYGIRFANGAGAITVSREGAQASLPSRQELEEFLTERRGV